MTCITQKIIKPKRVKTPCRLYIVDTPKEDIAMAIKGEDYTLLYSCSSRFTEVDQANLTYAHNTFDKKVWVKVLSCSHLNSSM